MDEMDKALAWSPGDAGEGLHHGACGMLPNLLQVQAWLHELMQVDGHAPQCAILRACHSCTLRPGHALLLICANKPGVSMGFGLCIFTG